MMMKTYLTRWNENGVNRSAILNVTGIRRVMRKVYVEKTVRDVVVYYLSDDMFIPPTPVRIWYDYVKDKLTLFDMRGKSFDRTEVA